MIKWSLICIIFVTLNNVITTEQYDINKNICADCESYLRFCRISSYGFSVQLDDDSDKISINTQNSTTDDSLADCVPPVYQISEFLEGFACFWSKRMGCNMVLGRREQEKGFDALTCLQCYDYCPCFAQGLTFATGHRKSITVCLGIILVINKVLFGQQ